MKIPKGRFKAIIDEQVINSKDLLDILAEGCGISPALLLDYYEDKVDPKPHHIIEICNYLNRVFHENQPLYSLINFTEEWNE